MNGNDLGNNFSDKNTYRAVSNLNTAIENPQMNMNSTMGVNIQDVESSFNGYTNNSFLVQNAYNDNSNLNTAENPQMNMNSTMNINGQPLGGHDSESVSSNISNFYDRSFEQNSYNTASNLNTAIENPQMNMNSVMGVNISNVDSSLENSNNNDKFNFINGANNNQEISDFNGTASQYGYAPVDDDAMYAPVMEEKKKKEELVIPRELKLMFFIVLILVVIVLTMPYVYDFFREIKLSITTG